MKFTNEFRKAKSPNVVPKGFSTEFACNLLNKLFADIVDVMDDDGLVLVVPVYDIISIYKRNGLCKPREGNKYSTCRCLLTGCCGGCCRSSSSCGSYGSSCSSGSSSSSRCCGRCWCWRGSTSSSRSGGTGSSSRCSASSNCGDCGCWSCIVHNWWCEDFHQRIYGMRHNWHIAFGRLIL